MRSETPVKNSRVAAEKSSSEHRKKIALLPSWRGAASPLDRNAHRGRREYKRAADSLIPQCGFSQMLQTPTGQALGNWGVAPVRPIRAAW